MYDAYAAMAQRAGAVIIPLKLNEDNWSIPQDSLEQAFSDRTKLILINTPHNPSGKVACHSQVLRSGKSAFLGWCSTGTVVLILALQNRRNVLKIA